ncbi:hypothetical protein vseg_013898 [Gypsophila vaccaria]
MVEERGREPGTELRKRKNRFKKPPNAKKMKAFPGMGKKNKVPQKLKKLFRKRARDYNSDSDDVDESENDSVDEDKKRKGDGNSGRTDGEEEHDGEVGEDVEESDEDDRVPPTKFGEGCNAFRTAFQTIMSIPAGDESLGPILSAHKKLVVEKLAEEDTQKKVVKQKKKEKISIDERGHEKPANFLDTHDKVLIGIATKGVVKFFNAVNKAQTAQKGLNPSRFKDAKALTKRRKEAFMSELKRASSQSGDAATKTSAGQDDSNQPAWAPLRDSFMLTNSKLKDWDKMAEENEAEI